MTQLVDNGAAEGELAPLRVAGTIVALSERAAQDRGRENDAGCDPAAVGSRRRNRWDTCSRVYSGFEPFVNAVTIDKDHKDFAVEVGEIF